MSFGRIISGFVRGLLIAVATAVAAFGLLVVFHPFASTPAPAPATVSVVTGDTGAEAMHTRIEAIRKSLRETEARLAAVRSDGLSMSALPPLASAPVDDGVRAQYEAQIAAATERRDLALRHASAIRDALAAGTSLAALAEIRDSVMIGQLLARQAALEAEIAETGARLKASHPTMLALTAQRTTLTTQIEAEAGSIAAALEAEAKMDDAQIKLLSTQLTSTPTATVAADTASPARAVAPDTAKLEAQAASQQAQLDGLMDAYFNLAPASATATIASPAARAASPLTLVNLAVVAIAAIAAILFQVLLAIRRRRARHARADIDHWRTDSDPELAVEPVAIVDPVEPRMRAAS